MKRPVAAPVFFRSLFTRLRWWQTVGMSAVVAAAAYGLFFHNLFGLLPGYSTSELETFATASQFNTILHTPINAPYTVVVWVLQSLTGQGIAVQRMLSAVLGIGAGVVFWFIVRAQYNWRVSVYATTLFVCSAQLLHAARLGTPMLLQMSAMLFFALALFYHMYTRKIVGLYIGVGALAVLLYIPGLFWFIVAGAIVMRRIIVRLLWVLRPIHVTGLVMLFAIIVTPLAWSVFNDSGAALTMLGLPHSVPTPIEFARNLAHVPLSFGVQAFFAPEIALPGTALLSFAESILFVLGTYELLRAPRLKANYFVFAALALGSILVAAGGSVAYVIVTPLVYLVIAAGIRYAQRMWFQTFPRNPFARYLGVAAMSLIIGFCCLYQLRSYFVAWPHNSQTKAVFNNRL